MAAPLGNKYAVGSVGSGRTKAGDILFLMKMMEGELRKKDLPACSLKKVLYELAVEKKDVKVLNKIMDKLYANQQRVEMDGAVDLSLLESKLKELSHGDENTKDGGSDVQGRAGATAPVDTESSLDIQSNIQEALS